MWKATGDVKWRDRGWAMFEAIEKHAKVGRAYASVKNVYKIPVPHEDDLPRYVLAVLLDFVVCELTNRSLPSSFFFAET